MDSQEEGIRFRGKEGDESGNALNETQEVKVEEKPVKVVQKPEEDDSYNVEKDPRYRCLFIMLKIVIAILVLICLAIIFFNWIAPHLVPNEHKIQYLRERLMGTMCQGECTDKDLEDIENIIKRVREEM